jgi:DNA gyrase subunit A
LLSDRENILAMMIDELTEVKNKFGDDRLTEISNEAANIDNEDLLPQENILVVLTKKGYVKRMSDNTFRTQNRGGRGVKGITTTAGDLVQLMLHTKTHTDIMFFSSLGFVYRLRGYMIPDGERNSKGIPAVNLLNLAQDEKIVAIVPCDDYPESDYLFFTTVNGVVKRTKLTEFASIHSNGKRAITLKEGDELLDVKRTHGNDIISLASSNGKVCSFHEEEVRAMGRTAAGVTGMNLKDGSHLVDVTGSMEGKLILVLSANGFGKLSYCADTDVVNEDGSTTHYDGYRLTSRGAKGVFSLKMNGKNGGLTAMRAVNGDEDLMVITNKGIVIRTPLSQIHIAGRNTVGVKIISLDPGNRVASLAIVPHIDEDAEDEVVEDDEINPSLLSEEERETSVSNPTPDDVEEGDNSNEPNPTPDDVE